jgi:glutathione S-transferase
MRLFCRSARALDRGDLRSVLAATEHDPAPVGRKLTAGGIRCRQGESMTGGVYKLYGRVNAGSLAPQIVLEEIGAPYQIVWVSKTPADLEALRRVHPAGKIPVLVLPDGTVVAESAAILIHLTHQHPEAALAPAAASSEHARFLESMVFLSASLYETALRYYYCERYCSDAAAAPEVKAQAVADYARHLERIHGELSPYVLGNKLSAADPYLHMLAGWYPDEVRPLLSRLPKLAQHAELLRRRPATRKAERDHAGT